MKVNWIRKHAFDCWDQITEVGNPIIILTGGEPLLRPDIFDIASYGTRKGTANG